MLDLRQKIDEAAAFIRSKWDHTPKVGIILGTGLGGFAREVQEPTTIPYRDIPHFPRSTAIGHKGQLVCGMCNGVPVATMEGRFAWVLLDAVPVEVGGRRLGASWDHGG